MTSGRPRKNQLVNLHSLKFTIQEFESFAVHKSLAGGRGFEPLDRNYPVNGLAIHRIKPTLPTAQ